MVFSDFLIDFLIAISPLLVNALEDCARRRPQKPFEGLAKYFAKTEMLANIAKNVDMNLDISKIGKRGIALASFCEHIVALNPDISSTNRWEFERSPTSINVDGAEHMAVCIRPKKKHEHDPDTFNNGIGRMAYIVLLYQTQEPSNIEMTEWSIGEPKLIEDPNDRNLTTDTNFEFEEFTSSSEKIDGSQGAVSLSWCKNFIVFTTKRSALLIIPSKLREKKRNELYNNVINIIKESNELLEYLETLPQGQRMTFENCLKNDSHFVLFKQNCIVCWSSKLSPYLPSTREFQFSQSPVYEAIDLVSLLGRVFIQELFNHPLLFHMTDTAWNSLETAVYYTDIRRIRELNNWGIPMIWTEGFVVVLVNGQYLKVKPRGFRLIRQIRDLLKKIREWSEANTNTSLEYQVELWIVNIYLQCKSTDRTCINVSLFADALIVIAKNITTWGNFAENLYRETKTLVENPLWKQRKTFSGIVRRLQFEKNKARLDTYLVKLLMRKH